MPRLTLRTLLAYIDDTLGPIEARSLGKKVAESDEARHLVERIKRVTRRRGLAAPDANDEDDAAGDPNTVAEYLDNALDSDTLKQVEETCLDSDVHLAEVAACHQILTLVLTEPVRVPPRAHRRMYELVQPPASVPNRRPSRTLPVSAAAPTPDRAADADDADAALLFGMKRYSATTWATRFALFGATAILLVVLAGAVWKSLSPPSAATAPEVAKGAPNPALYTDARPVVPPDLPAPKPKEPDPAPKPKDKASEPVAPKPKDKEPDPVVPPKPKDKDGPEPAPLPKPVNVDKWDEIPPPLAARDHIGRVATDNALVLSYRTNPEGAGAWYRLPFKPPTELKDDASVFSADPVMAVPGYKASVLLGEIEKPVVDVLLWGNIPEQLPYRVLESKVVFHQPPAGFDADLTLHAGRIYLKSVKLDADKKSLPAKVRVRLANSKEMWDITLPDANTDVLVELISWYKPGTAFSVKGGADPRREARVAVVRGPAGFQTTGERFKKADKIDGGTQVQWDSVTGRLSDPTPSTNLQETDRVPTLDGDFQKLLTRILSDMAKPVTDPGSLAVVLKDRMDLKLNIPPAEEMTATLSARLAIYALAATAPSTEAGAQALQPLINILNSTFAWPSRQAAVTALVQWVGRERGNTALIHALMSKPDSGIQPTTTADAVVEMLRGYISPVNPDPSALDTLVSRLGGVKANQFEKPEQAIALRDVALWNLAVAEQGVWTPAPFRVNIAAEKPDDPKYKAFVEFWEKRVADIKKRPKTP